MSVVGIDFGNLTSLVAQAGKGGVDVILNDSSNRQTATCISFQGKQRLLGDAAATIARSNIVNTITSMKLLVGRKYDGEDVQSELRKCPFATCRLPNGGIGAKVSYKDETIVISMEQALAMMLVKLKSTAAKANNNVGIAEAVLAVPFWFTDAQRRGILAACEIASLNCLKVSNESTAVALSYGIFKSAKKLFSETEPTHVMFIDIGYTGYCVSIVDFIQENMRVLSTVTSREVGGRDFDDAIIEYIAENFQKKYGINVRGNWKAMLKMQAAAEKAKKILSPTGVSEASLSVECLAEDRDFNQNLTKEEFDKRSKYIIDKLAAPVHQALHEAGLTKEQISEVEIVGGSTRIGIVKRTLAEILGLDLNAMNYGLKTTMNSDEAVARGAALQCAILSSRMKVKPFNIVDRLPYGIVAHFEASASAPIDGESKEDIPVTGSSAAIYSHNDEIPHKPRRLTFRRKSADFSLTLAYDDVAALPAGEERVIGRYTIKVPPSLVEKNGPGDVRVNFNLDKNGLVYIASAQFMEEIPADEGSGDSKEDSKGEGKTEGDAVTAQPKKKFRKIDLEVVSDIFSLTRDDIRIALDFEAKLQYEDRILTETADKRNELEAYIYGMRSKLDGALKTYSSKAESDKLSGLMNEAEDWLYGDGFDSTIQEYAARLDGLRAVGNVIESRLWEENNRQSAIDALKKQIDMCKTFASDRDESKSHITEEERGRVREATGKAESWLFDIQGQQADLARNANPVLTVDAVNKKRNELFSVANPVMTKPKPKPAPAPAPAPAADAQQEGKTEPESSESKASEDSKPEGEGEPTPMDV